MGNSASASPSVSDLPPLQTVPWCDTDRFMGTWFVIGVKPTAFETTCSNAVEVYSVNDSAGMKKKKKKRGGGGAHDVNIDFRYNSGEPLSSPLKSLPQKGWIQGEDKGRSGDWKVSPVWPIKMPYLILECDSNYEYTVIGYPSRAYCWIMSRTPQMSDKTYSMLKKRLEEKHQYDLTGLRDVPQKWTRDERSRRGLTAKEIPDSMLEG